MVVGSVDIVSRLGLVSGGSVRESGRGGVRGPRLPEGGSWLRRGWGRWMELQVVMKRAVVAVMSRVGALSLAPIKATMARDVVFC